MKDEDAKKEMVSGVTSNFTVNWKGAAADGGPWLPDGSGIATSSWAIDEVGGESPVQLTEVSTSFESEGQCHIVVSGGTAGKVYRLKNSVTLSGDLAGVSDARTIYVTCLPHQPEQ